MSDWKSVVASSGSPSSVLECEGSECEGRCWKARGETRKSSPGFSSWCAFSALETGPDETLKAGLGTGAGSRHGFHPGMTEVRLA